MKVTVLADLEKSGDYRWFRVLCQEEGEAVEKGLYFGGLAEKVHGEDYALKRAVIRFCREARRDLAVKLGREIMAFDGMQDGAEVELVSAVKEMQCVL